MLRRTSVRAYLDLGNDEICKLRPLGIEDWNDTNEGLSPFCSQCMRFRLRCCLHVQELPEVSQESACVSHEFLRFTHPKDERYKHSELVGDNVPVRLK